MPAPSRRRSDSCVGNVPAPLNASVAKWFDNHAAAGSIANDERPTPGREPDMDGRVMEQCLAMGYHAPIEAKREVLGVAPAPLTASSPTSLHTNVSELLFTL